MSRIAVVLFNLGGPDGQAAVRPFLFNLFNDKAIIGAPQPVRWLLAQLIAGRRAPTARAIYARIGGGSPLRANTEAQAAALAHALADLGEVRVFPCMRYWHPRAAEVAAELAAFLPDEVVLLPLYPQYSTTTTGSSLADWRQTVADLGLEQRTRALCCYPTEDGFIAALAELCAPAWREAKADGPARLLLSAHGLPKRVIERGDPYAAQVEETAAALAARLALAPGDWQVCYQSRVGPLEWIGPATDAEIRRAGAEGVGLVVAPIAFVSEHSETLVELDIEYRHLAEASGVPRYTRVPAVGTAPAFIEGLARLVRRRLSRDGTLMSGEGTRRCQPERACCPMPAAEVAR